MIKSILKYSGLMLLAACSSSSNGGGGVSQRPTRPDTGGGNTGGGDGKKLDTMTNVKSLSTLISTENNSRIRTAFLNFNKIPANATDKISLTDTDYKYASQVLSKPSSASDITTRVGDITTLVTIYDEYAPKSNTHKSNKVNYLEKNRADFTVDGFAAAEVDAAYSMWLQVNSTNKVLRASFPDDAAYITAVESYYFKAITTSMAGASLTDYAAARAALGILLGTSSGELLVLESAILAALKGLDPSTTLLPLSLDKVIAFYKNQKKVLLSIGNVTYLADVTVNPVGAITAKSSGDAGGVVAVKYVYNAGLGDYVLELSETTKSGANKKDGVVTFKAGDFVSDVRSYVASSIRNIETTKNHDTFLPNLKNYLYAGGDFEFEVSARKSYAIAVFNKVKSGKASAAEKTMFTTWTGISTDVAFSASDLKIFSTALAVITKSQPNFGIDLDFKIQDTVRLGGKSLGLSFSDFGLWSVKGMKQYSGDSHILANDKNKYNDSTYYVDYPFFSGIDAFKRGYAPNPALEVGSKVIFSGNAFGAAVKVGKVEADTQRQDLSGTAKLIINNDNSKGNLSLDFDKWYGFTFSDVDLSNSNGFTGSDVTITNTSSVTGIKFGGTPALTGKVDGQMYGFEDGKPTEAVGSFNMSSGSIFGTDSDKYSEIKVEGAFGVKK